MNFVGDSVVECVSASRAFGVCPILHDMEGQPGMGAAAAAGLLL